MEDLLCFSMSFLKQHNYIVTKQHLSGTIKWSRHGEERASIRISVQIGEDRGVLTLDYLYKKESVNYNIQIVSKTSNLGNGKIWFFVCPNTGKLCRKLYGKKYFLHREAYLGIMYQKQIESKNFRLMDKLYGPYFESERLYEQLYKPYFKKYYKGKPTKKYLKITERLSVADKISHHDIERLLVSGI
ncbi:hypothetical protein ACMGDK_18845 [Chryseobacterium sp. DT-3]|uniref:hypothetical protein n=1 Tax=Chryseobacterium sp. DT-3 TaxID=3396164 RepID=UPI003F1A240C